MNRVHTETLSIKQGELLSKSYLAYLKDQEPKPGILLFHEFWGLTEHIKHKAAQLAEQSYTVLAPDLYGEGWTAGTAEKATSAMQKIFSDMEKTSKQLTHFLQILKNLKQTDENQTASIGYCMGGTLSLQMARMGLAIDGVVSFHGNLEAHHSIAPGQVKAKILILNGEKDPLVPEEQIQNFKKEMDSTGADYHVIHYPNALHGFTNPQATENGKRFNLPTAYNESAAQASWEEMLKFFKTLFYKDSR